LSDEGGKGEFGLKIPKQRSKVDPSGDENFTIRRRLIPFFTSCLVCYCMISASFFCLSDQAASLVQFVTPRLRLMIVFYKKNLRKNQNIAPIFHSFAAPSNHQRTPLFSSQVAAKEEILERVLVRFQ
jgi:hypothetical protein